MRRGGWGGGEHAWVKTEHGGSILVSFDSYEKCLRRGSIRIMWAGGCERAERSITITVCCPGTPSCETCPGATPHSWVGFSNLMINTLLFYLELLKAAWLSSGCLPACLGCRGSLQPSTGHGCPTGDLSTQNVG